MLSVEPDREANTFEVEASLLKRRRRRRDSRWAPLRVGNDCSGYGRIDRISDYSQITWLSSSVARIPRCARQIPDTPRPQVRRDPFLAARLLHSPAADRTDREAS